MFPGLGSSVLVSCSRSRCLAVDWGSISISRMNSMESGPLMGGFTRTVAPGGIKSGTRLTFSLLERDSSKEERAGSGTRDESGIEL